jgi:hypothetical protein
MKNTIFLFIAALFITASVNAQSTVDSIRAKYTLQPMPGALTIEKAFPVLGTYHLTTDSTTTLTVSMDSASKGIVWVEGLPQGKFKAFLKQSPATYRITAQKTESGTSVPEGTLMFDTTTNTLNIALGKAYNEANPGEIFGTVADAGVSTDVANTGTEVKVKTKTKTTKSKAKVVFYSATKVQNTTATTGSLQPQGQQ